MSPGVVTNRKNILLKWPQYDIIHAKVKLVSCVKKPDWFLTSTRKIMCGWPDQCRWSCFERSPHIAICTSMPGDQSRPYMRGWYVCTKMYASLYHDLTCSSRPVTKIKFDLFCTKHRPYSQWAQLSLSFNQISFCLYQITCI